MCLNAKVQDFVEFINPFFGRNRPILILSNPVLPLVIGGDIV